jgi:hypothetical protein
MFVPYELKFHEFKLPNLHQNRAGKASTEVNQPSVLLQAPLMIHIVHLPEHLS